MTTVVFYQKTGCATNARQIRTLEAAGHSVTAKDLLNAPWTAEELRSFFGETPVPQHVMPVELRKFEFGFNLNVHTSTLPLYAFESTDCCQPSRGHRGFKRKRMKLAAHPPLQCSVDHLMLLDPALSGKGL